MVVIMLPFIFFPLYEKDGQPAETYLYHIVPVSYTHLEYVRPAELHSQSAEENCPTENVSSLRSVKGSKICRKTPKYSDYSSWNAYYEAYSVSIVNMPLNSEASSLKEGT